ncbi:hypothetical protein HF086_006685, partial [Spodoptera exigua]
CYLRDHLQGLDHNNSSARSSHIQIWKEVPKTTNLLKCPNTLLTIFSLRRTNRWTRCR